MQRYMKAWRLAHFRLTPSHQGQRTDMGNLTSPKANSFGLRQYRTRTEYGYMYTTAKSPRQASEALESQLSQLQVLAPNGDWQSLEAEGPINIQQPAGASLA